MMERDMSQQQRGVVAAAAVFAADHVAPAAAALDHAAVYPKELIAQMAAQGMFGLLLPVRWQGAGLGFSTFIEVVRTLSGACPAVASILNHHTLAASAIEQWGDNVQKSRILPALARGERLATFALMESGAAVGIGHDALIATREDTSFTLIGEKTFVRNAGVADIYVVFATLAKAEGGTGLAAFVIEAGMAGLTVGRTLETMGLNGCPVADLIFTGASVSQEALLHDASAGAAIAERLNYLGAVAEAAQTVGIAQSASRHAAAYAKHRVQFHRPIAHQEAIQTMLAEMVTDSHLAWHGVQHAAQLIDEGAPFEVEAAMVKSFLARFGAKMLVDGCQIEGGLGISESAPKGVREDLPLARMFRDIAGTTLLDAPGDFPEQLIAASIV